ncbi:cyclin E isoform 1-T3 [Glossina fuscipes fuscipes]
MDYYKSRHHKSSTKSNHNTNNPRSHVLSHKTADNTKSYELERCTSVSPSSPSSHRPLPRSSCISSVNKAVVVKVKAEEVVISFPDDCSHISSSSSELISTTSQLDTNKTAAKISSSHGKTVTKRKRRSSSSLDYEDPELDFEPTAKRKQRLSSVYESETVTSMVSSVYPSPVDDMAIVNEIEIHSSSECLSMDNAGFEIPHDDIPDSPSSLQPDQEMNEEIVDCDDMTDEEDAGSSSSSIVSGVSLYDNTTHRGERTPREQCSPIVTATTATINDSGSSKFCHQSKVCSFDKYVNDHYDCLTPVTDPESPRQCPLPALSWANAQDVWRRMCRKDEQASCLRDPVMLENHPGLQPRMRAILLDWLIEVCEVYKLHRETYYLAVDYLDRYLSTQKNVQKTHLQLIGITCLFVAAKVEEIYPPKIGEFAYVTDGACEENDILKHEILLLQALQWNISPVTAIGWLGVYMQLNVNNRTPASFSTVRNPILNHHTNVLEEPMAFCFSSKASSMTEIDDAFVYPQFSGLEFVQTAQLLDLCSLDVGIANFSYSVISAAAISHTFNRETAIRCSGLNWHSIQSCAEWMQPFFDVICEESHHLHLLEQNEQIDNKYGLGYVCPNIVTDDSHIIQTHTTTMAMFDRVYLIKDHNVTTKLKQEASPATGLVCPEGLLTPPASSRKPMVTIDEEKGEEQQQHHHVSSGSGIIENAACKRN